MEKLKIYDIPNFEDYELHYSDEQQLVYSNKREKYLKLCKDKGGYLLTRLYKNGKGRTFLLHQLVWMCLKGDIPKGYEINHIDEVKTNNCIENLELVTAKENCNHGTRTLRAAKAMKIAMIGKHINRQDQSKPIVGIKKDLSEILQYPSTHEASRDKEKGFHQGHISECCLNRKNYKTHKDFIWFYKDDFEEYMNRFNNNLEKVIEYKKSISKK